MDTRGIWHNLDRALSRLELAKDIRFDFPEETIDFIHYLNGECENRYFAFPYELRRGFLAQLDRAAWYIRRYCFDYRSKAKPGQEEHHKFPPRELERIQSEETKNNPHKFKIPGGMLEKIMDQPESEARAILIWKNFYWGKYHRQKISDFPMKIAYGHPTHYSFPQYLPLISQYVYIPPKVLRYLEAASTKLKSQPKRDKPIGN